MKLYIENVPQLFGQHCWIKKATSNSVRLPISSTIFSTLFLGTTYPFGKVFFSFSEVQSGYRTWFFGVFLYALWILVRSPRWRPWIKSHHLGPNKTAIGKIGCFNWDASKSLHEKNGWTSPNIHGKICFFYIEFIRNNHWITGISNWSVASWTAGVISQIPSLYRRDWVVGPPTCNPKAIFGDLANS